MEARTVETTQGVVTIWADWLRLAPTRPLLLVIRGVFPPAGQLTALPTVLAEADVAFVDLPGMNATPAFAVNSPWSFAEGVDQTVAALFPERPLAVLGVSMGGVVAMAMKAPGLRAILAVDPPLTVAGLWPLRNVLREVLAAAPSFADWIWDVLGFSVDAVEERDYRPILAALEVPTHVLLASDPLEPRRLVDRLPSLASESERALYAAHPFVSIEVVPDSGHDLPGDRPAAVLTPLVAMLAAVG
jgi:pimeloyl-ACP methyl ester carboxylesterase